MSNTLLAAATTASSTTTNKYTSTNNSSSSTSSSNSSSSTTGVASGMGQDAFLKMFMAQMTNQDPLNPMDNTQFTAQLAQFSSLEQLTQINKNLSNLTTLQDTMSQTQALSYLGKEVTMSGTSMTLSGGVSSTMNFTLPSNAYVKAVVTDSSGSVVATGNLGSLTAGSQQFTWDGTTSTGTKAPDGTYTVTLSATDTDGNTVKISDQSVTGQVTGFKKGSDGKLYLMMGNSTILLSNVISVKQPTTTSSTLNNSALSDWLNSQLQNASSSNNSSSSSTWQSLINSLLGNSSS